MLIFTYYTVFFLIVLLSYAHEALSINLRFSQQPRDVTVGVGQAAVFHCQVDIAQRPGVESIVWLKDGATLRLDSRRRLLKNGSLLIRPVQRRRRSGSVDDGRYRCRITLSEGRGALVSRDARLQVAYLADVFSMEPVDATRRLGESVSFRCSLKSVPDPPRIQWLFSSSNANMMMLPMPLKSTPGKYTLLDMGRVLELTSLTQEQLGFYFCRVSLPKGLVGTAPDRDTFRNSKKAALKLRTGDRGKAPIPLTFELSPMDVAVPEGETAELLCSANGRTSPSEAGRKPVITWLFGIVSISVKSNRRHSVVGSGSLRIKDVNMNDAGVYTCRASLPNGMDKFVKARLMVQAKPSFTRRPEQEVQGFVQQELTLPCAAQGNPEPTVEWRKNGRPLTGMDEYFQTVGSNLRIVGLLAADAALYQCLASNAVGNVQTWTQLSVQRRPTQASTPTGEPLSPPGTPLALKQMTVGRDYVHLEWQPPGDTPPSDVTKSGQLSYDVVWKKRGHERVRQKNTTSRGLLIDRLSPHTAYDFSVYAVLRPAPGSVSVRSTNPARISVQTLKPVATPVSVVNLRSRGISSSEIRIQWVNPEDSDKYVQHYKILIYNVSDPQARQPQNLTVRPQDPRPGAETELTVPFLHPYALYRVLVFGVNASGRGIAKENRVRTKEAKPDAPPQNVSVQVTGSRSVTVRWLPPPTALRNGEIVAYKLRYKRVSADGQALGKAKVESLSGEKTGFSLTKLERNTPYMVKISARTAIGPGPFSPWVKFRTLAIDPDGAGYENRAPGPVEGLDARGLPNAIVLSWFKPDGGRTQVTKYVIHWGRLHDDEKRETLPGSRQEYTIRGLEHSVTYIIRVDPYNQHGLGKSVYKDVTTRRQPVSGWRDEDKTSIPLNLRATLSKTTTAILSWDDPDGPDASRRDGRMYELRYYPTSGQDRVSPSRSSGPNRRPIIDSGDLGDDEAPKGTISVNVTSTRARVARLRPNTKYEFKVRTIKRSSGGKRWVKSVWSFVESFQTREDKPGSPPQDLTLTPVTGELRSIKLAWQPPLLPNGLIEHYIIYFTADRNLPLTKWVQRTVKGTQLNLKLPNLDYDILYYCQIRAVNTQGAGPFSPIRIYKTPDKTGRNGGPVRLSKDYYDLGRVPTRNLRPDPTYGSPIVGGETGQGRGEEDEGLGGGLGDKTWWVIIGAVFGAAMLLIICIIICLCWCRPNAFMFAVNQRRTANGYKLGSKVPSDSADGSLEPAGKVTPLPPPSLKPPDLFTHRAPGGEHPHYEMERRDSESGSDSVRYQPTAAPNGLLPAHQRAHVRIGSQGQPIKPKPMLLPVQDAMQPPRDPVAMVTAIGGPAGVGRGMMPAPNGHMPGPAPFHRAQFAMSGPGAVGAPVTSSGPRVNASDIASQPSSEELQPLMSSSQISQPGVHQSPRYPEYTTYSPATTVVYDNATVKSSGSEKSSGTEGGGGPPGIMNGNMRGRRLATSPSANNSFVPHAHHRASRHPQSSPGSGESPNSSPHFVPQHHHHHIQQQQQPAVRPRTVAVQPLLNGVPKAGGSPFHAGPKTACMANVGGPAAGPSGKPLRPAPVLAEGGDSASEISRGYSTEKLNQEMANLEGLMKDLNAMTQKEFEC